MITPARTKKCVGGTLSLPPGDYFGVPPLGKHRQVRPRGVSAALRTQTIPFLAALLLCIVGLGLQGCGSVSSTAQRSAAVALGGAIGGLAAHEISGGNAAATGGGAVAGGMLTHLGLGRDPAVLQDGFDQGYVRGQSDAIKRHYFLRQALERRPLDSAAASASSVTYLMPGPSSTVDGIRLAPHLVAKTVRE